MTSGAEEQLKLQSGTRMVERRAKNSGRQGTTLTLRVESI
jgi:hypothetical protein